MRKLILAACLALASLLTGHMAHAACPVPNPNLLAPPFYDGCPLPSVALNRLGTIANTTALRALPTTSAINGGVWRATDGVAGAGPLYFTVGSAPCGTDDGAICVNSSNGKSWVGYFPNGRADIRQFSCAANDTDVSACMNVAVADAIAAGVPEVDFPAPGNGNYYGVCAAPLTYYSLGTVTTGTDLVATNAVVKVPPGCGAAPQEVFSLSIAYTIPAYWQKHTLIKGFTFDGSYKTKYVAYLAGAETLYLNNTFQNPVSANTIAGSAGVYWPYGEESFLGSSNKIVAFNQPGAGNDPYTSPSTLPAYGLYVGTGNNTFTGLLVVGYNVGIYDNAGSDYYGPGTHVWGGVDYVTGTGVWNSAIRTQKGIEILGTAELVEGVEIDDAAVYAIDIEAGGNNVSNVDCFYGGSDTITSQVCVNIATGQQATVSGTQAAAIFNANLPAQIVQQTGTPNADSVIAHNPGASYDNLGTGVVTATSGAAAGANPAGTLGPSGYSSSLTSEQNAWVVGPCSVRKITLAVNTAPGSGQTLTATVWQNGSAQTMAASITGASTFTATSSASSVEFTAPGYLAVVLSSSGGSVASSPVLVTLTGCP